MNIALQRQSTRAAFIFNATVPQSLELKCLTRSQTWVLWLACTDAQPSCQDCYSFLVSMLERVLETFGHWYEVFVLYENDKHVITDVMDDSITLEQSLANSGVEKWSHTERVLETFGHLYEVLLEKNTKVTSMSSMIASLAKSGVEKWDHTGLVTRVWQWQLRFFSCKDCKSHRLH